MSDISPSKSAYVRTYYLSRREEEILKRLSRDLQKSQSSIIRESLREYFERYIKAQEPQDE